MLVSFEEACRLLLLGHVVALPTETVYGLACLPFDSQSVQEVFRIKQRPNDNPLICHFYSIDQMLAEGLQPGIRTLTLMRWAGPGPLSYRIPLPESHRLAAATAGQNSIVVRFPSPGLFSEVMVALQSPLAAPSANTSGKLSPTTAAMVESDLGAKGIAVLDGGSCAIGLESTIVDCLNDRNFSCLRLGGFPVERLKEKVVELGGTWADQETSTAITPGSKYRHYAPRTPLRWIHEDQLNSLSAGTVVVAIHEDAERLRKTYAQLIWFALGSNQDWKTIGKDLYRRLFELDALKLSHAWVLEPTWIEDGLCQAIRNRLKKAVSGS
jgi:L-threonylcarbamoyladenylate synthase